MLPPRGATQTSDRGLERGGQRKREPERDREKARVRTKVEGKRNKESETRRKERTETDGTIQKEHVRRGERESRLMLLATSVLSGEKAFDLIIWEGQSASVDEEPL